VNRDISSRFCFWERASCWRRFAICAKSQLGCNGHGVDNV